LDIINKFLNKILKSNPTIEVFEITKKCAQKLLKDKKYMQYHIESNEDSKVRIAKIGDYKSLISYPIITNLSKLKNHKFKNISFTNWLRDVNNEPLQRVSGVAFSSEKA
jgi:threonyl-tRNA synthetase